MFDHRTLLDNFADAADPVLQLRMGVAALAGEQRAHWSGTAKSERLLDLLEIGERLEAEILRLTGEWDRDRAWEIDGALSPRAWLAIAPRSPITGRGHSSSRPTWSTNTTPSPPHLPTAI